MLLKIAWRNLWRNKRRTLVVLSSIIFGVGMLFISDGISRGFALEMFDNQIKQHISQMQIHKMGYEKHKEVKKVIPNPELLEKTLDKIDGITNYSQRSVVFGLLSSASSSSGCALIGIVPEDEKKITSIHTSIIDGKYFSRENREIVIGKKMAEKLDVEVGDKLVATASDINGDVSNELFRVVGIYKASSNDFEKLYVYVPLNNAQRMLNLGDSYHEIAMITKDRKQIDKYQNVIKSQLSDDYEVLSFKNLIPMMMMYLDMYEQMIFIFYAIIGLAVLFGVVNSMLMSVFERIQEFGVLMSIGMARLKVFNMVILEALVLGVLGTFLGGIFGFIMYLPLSIYGLDLTMFSEGLNAFGISHVIKPIINTNLILNNILIMPIITILGAIYPARKAIKLQPTEAMRYV